MKKAITLSVLFMAVLFLTITLSDEATHGAKKAVIYYFYGNGCPQCDEVKPHIKKMAAKYHLVLKQYEVWYSDKNRNLLLEMARKRNVQVRGVPVVIIGNNVLLGKKKIDKLEEYIKKQN